MPTPSDLVHETTTSTGTGNLTVTSESGKRTFNTAFGTGSTDLFDYFISHRTAAEWEIGTGHLSASTTFVRDTVIASSNANAAVDFSVGTKDVTNDVRAANQARAAATQTEMETGTATDAFVSPGRQHFHPAHPKAIYSATITPTQITGNISSVDTGTEIITWSTTHGLTTGEVIIPNGGTWPTGVTLNTPYYVNALSTTTFALYATRANALADTSRVNLTAAGSGTRTLRRFAATDEVSYGMVSAGPVCAVTAVAAMGFELHLDPAFSTAKGLYYLQISGLAGGAGATQGLGARQLSSIGTSTLVLPNANYTLLVNAAGNADATVGAGWVTQAGTAFRIEFIAWGDI